MSNRRRLPPIDLWPTGVTAGSYGSASSVPTFTVNAQGQLTSAGSAAVSPDLTATVFNNTGGTLTAGTLVAIDGYNVANSAFNVIGADASSARGFAVYVLDAAIADQATGTASKKATLTGLNTAGASVGDAVYLSTTAGVTTLTAPTGADEIQQIVGRVSVVSATVGQAAIELLDAEVSKIGTSGVQDGFLSADATGRAKTGAAFVDYAMQKIRTAVALADADATLSATQMVDSSIFTITPTVPRTLTTATAADLVAQVPRAIVGTTFQFCVLVGASQDVTLQGGTNVTIVGANVLNLDSGTFWARLDNVTASSEAVTIYRAA